MRYSIIFAAGLASIVAAAPAALQGGLDFASIEAAPLPSVTGPPATATSDIVSIDPTSVSSVGAAAATAETSAAATTSLPAKDKRDPHWVPCTTDSCSVTKPSWDDGWGWGSSASTKAHSTSKGWDDGWNNGWGWGSSSSTKAHTSTKAHSSSKATASPTVAPPYTTPEVSKPCATQPDGYGPKVQPDTPEAFANYEEFQRESLSAITPLGYESTFKDLNASVSGVTYLGLTTYTSYDVGKCGAQCDSTKLCTGFNIYVERDPSVNPHLNCSNPASITNYKCTLWGSSVEQSMATNYGQYREGFHVVIAGSNGYTKPAPPPKCHGWAPPQKCGDGKKAHSHPQSSIGEHFFPGPFNPDYCSAFAAEQNKKNEHKINSWKPTLTNSNNPYKCTFFNAYMLKKLGQPMGTYCSLFTQHYPGEAATYTPEKHGWDIESSWTYTLEHL
jgi:hypothetical protein